MKKIIVCALAMAMLSTSAYAQGINTNVDLHTNDVTVSGTGMTSSNNMLSIEVLNSDKNKVYIGTFAPSSDGSYSFTFRMPSDSQTGNYDITIGSYDGEVATETMFFATGEVIENTMNDINSSNTVTAMKAALNSHYEVLNISKSVYESLDDTAKTAVANVILNGKSNGNYTDISEVNALVRTEVAVQVLRCAKTGTDVKNALSTYSSIYNITEETSVCYALVEKMGEEDLSAVYYIMANGTCSDVTSAQKLYDSSVLLAYINKAKDPGTIKTTLANTSYQNVLGFSMSTYNSSDKDKTVTYLYNLGTDFTSAAQLEQAIKDAYSSQGSTSSGGSSSGGGGGSSSLGGSSSSGGTITNLPAATATTPANTDETKTDKTEYINFGDIDSVEWAREAIEYLASENIVSGVEDGVFKPNDTVTREQFATMLVKAFNLNGGNSDFTDLDNNHWAFDAVSAAYANGIISGISDTEFGTGRNITREDMATMLYRASQKMGITLNDGDINFTDSEDISDYAFEAVKAMNNSGVISGYSDGTFGPKDNATRAQAAQMLYMLIK